MQEDAHTLSPRNLAASSVSLRSTRALSSSGANSLAACADAILTLPVESLMTRYGTCWDRHRPFSLVNRLHDAAGGAAVLRCTIISCRLHARCHFPPTCLLSSLISSILRPMKRFTEKKVFSGFTTACRFAICHRSRACVSLPVCMTCVSL
jgi:hypothetical protein